MKFFLLLLPVVLAAPEKRIVLPDLIHNLHLDNLFQLDALKCDIQIMLDVLGSDPTEHACENECTKVISAGNVLAFGCPLICQGFSQLVHKLHITPGSSDCTSTAPAGKRSILSSLEHMFHLDTLKCDIQIMLDVLGSDPAEHACEDECTKVILAGNVLASGCPLICQGFSSLVHTLHITPGSADCSATNNPHVPVGKRAVPDLLHLLNLNNIFQLDALKCDIQMMLDALGSDPAEHACEAECHKLIQGGHVLDAGCPLICQGFSQLVHKLHITPGTSDCTAIHLDTLKCDIQIMLDVLGSDPTEHACEDECTKVILAGNVLASGCPLICQGFSSLVHKLHIPPGSADCSATNNPQVPLGKRAAPDLLHLLQLNNIFQLDALKCDIQIMLDALGSDPAEHACEAECHKLIHEGHVLGAGCPLICQGFSALVSTSCTSHQELPTARPPPQQENELCSEGGQ